MDDKTGEELEQWYIEAFKADYDEFKAREQECGVYVDTSGIDVPPKDFLQVGGNYFCHAIDYSLGLRVTCFRLVHGHTRAIAHYLWNGRASLAGHTEKGVVSLDTTFWFSETALLRYAERIAHYYRGLKDGNS